MKISTQRGFDRRNEFWIDIKLGDERADDSGSKAIGIIHAFEHGL